MSAAADKLARGRSFHLGYSRRVAVALEHSKRQVNLAGKLLRDLRAVIRTDDASALSAFDANEIHHAIQVVEWWRTMHSRPLARVNANLRYYVRKAKAEPEVTQRLKRFGTICHKLAREPTMALTKMEDIGGVASSSRRRSRYSTSARCSRRQIAGRSVDVGST